MIFYTTPSDAISALRVCSTGWNISRANNVGGWDHITELKNFVDGSMVGSIALIAVSCLVNSKCQLFANGEYDERMDKLANIWSVGVEKQNSDNETPFNIASL